MDDERDLGAEFYRWEMATAVAGAVLGLNPFDQPDVESAKLAARSLMASYENGTPGSSSLHPDWFLKPNAIANRPVRRPKPYADERYCKFPGWH